MRQSKLFNVFFREKPVMMLVSLLNPKAEMYASTVAKQVDCTYSHVVKILQEFQKEGLVDFDKKGRLKFVRLTKKGKDLAESLERAKGLL